MTRKLKIEKYVKAITKNPTYDKYLTDAVEFGYSLAKEEIRSLKAALKAFEDIGEIPLTEWDDEY